MSLTDNHAIDHLAALESGELTSAELTRAYLDRIDSVDEGVRSFLLVDRDAGFDRLGWACARRYESR